MTNFSSITDLAWEHDNHVNEKDKMKTLKKSSADDKERKVQFELRTSRPSPNFQDQSNR